MNKLQDETLTEEILRDKIIHFPEGLPGFPDSRDFLMAQRPEERPFAWMRSVSDPGLTFAIVDAYSWSKEFILEVDDAILQEMGSLHPGDYAVYFILQVGQSGDYTTLQARPQAPILVNVRTRQARQVAVAAQPSVEKAEALCLLL